MICVSADSTWIQPGVDSDWCHFYFPHSYGFHIPLVGNHTHTHMHKRTTHTCYKHSTIIFFSSQGSAFRVILIKFYLVWEVWCYMFNSCITSPCDHKTPNYFFLVYILVWPAVCLTGGENKACPSGLEVIRLMRMEHTASSGQVW